MKSILSFYHKIYEQELSKARSLHLHSAKVVKRFFVSETEEILNEQLPYLPLSDKVGEEIVKTLGLRSSELKLTYFSMVRISRFVSMNTHEITRAYPLFSFDAEVIQKKGLYYLQINTASRNFIKGNIPSKISGHPEFRDLMNSQEIDLHFALNLSELIKSIEPKAKTNDLALFPELWSGKKLNAELKKPFKAGEKYIPAGVLALVEKEFNSFNSLGELETVAAAEEFSAPLNVLFNGYLNDSDEKRGIICEELNRSQLNAIDNSNSKVVSVISGPPGTGKSFTIANIAAEKMSKGNSILITSKNKEALDVIEEKIQRQIGLENLCVNPSRDGSAYFYGMGRHLDYILGHKFKKQFYTFDEVEKAFDNYQQAQDKHLLNESKLMSLFEKEKNYYGDLLEGRFTEKTGEKFHQKILEHRSKLSLPLWSELDNYYRGSNHVRSTAISTLKMVTQYMLERGIKKNRKHLRNYQAFLRSRDLARKEKLALTIDYNAVLTAFPVWLVRANDVSKVLPLEKEIFDILIVDEASQCDIPSLIPLMQRAKKIIVVGDSKQLAHISFISTDFETACRSNVPPEYQHLCKHRDYSVLDLVEDNIDPLSKVQLNEHFRSQFPIISFSNDQFYNRELDILTKRPVSISEHVSFVDAKGQRTKGYNEAETKTILAKIESIINTERKLPEDLKTSIGVLSPFRKQVDYIFRALMEKFSYQEIKQHHLMVGTAFSFQGNERDLMLLSLALDQKSVAGSFTFMNRKDVFNVSVTRARSQQIIYYSFTPKQLNPNSTISRFFWHYQKKLQNDTGRSTRDEFGVEVSNVFKEAGYEVWTNFNISGVDIDVLLKIDNDFIGIDLVGFPGEMEDYYSLERYKMIERGKVKLFPLSYPYWRGDREKCIQAVLDLIPKPVAEEKATDEAQEINDADIPEEEYTDQQPVVDVSAIIWSTCETNNSTYRITHKKVAAENFYINISRGQVPVGYLNITKSEDEQIGYIAMNLKRGHKQMDLLNWMLCEAKPFWEHHETLEQISTKELNLTKRERKVFDTFGFIQNPPTVNKAGDSIIEMVLTLRPKQEQTSEEEKSIEKDTLKKQTKRKYRKFDVDKISVVDVTDKWGGLLHLKLMRDKTVYGSLWMYTLQENSRIKTFITYHINKPNHMYRGLEEKLLNRMIQLLQDIHTTNEASIYTQVHPNNIGVFEMYKSFGFVEDFEDLQQRSDAIRMVRFTSNEKRNLYADRVVSERLGEKIIFKTLIPNKQGGIKFKLYFKDQIIGSLEVDTISQDGEEGWVYYNLDSNFLNIGLDTCLFEALRGWQDENNHLKQLCAYLPITAKLERILFTNYGFTKTDIKQRASKRRKRVEQDLYIKTLR